MEENEMLENGQYLLRSEKDILLKLAEAGMKEDDTEPYTYFIPSTLFFDVGRGKEKQLRAPYAIIAMAMAAQTEARFAYVAEDGKPNEEERNGYVRVQVYDPFAQKIEAAVRSRQTTKTDGDILQMSPEYAKRNCNRFKDWSEAVHAYEQAVSDKWCKDWTTEDWLICVKWMFATSWDGREPHG